MYQEHLRKRKKCFLYFDGYLQGSFLDLLDTITALKFWLEPVINNSIFEPITVVIK